MSARITQVARTNREKSIDPSRVIMTLAQKGTSGHFWIADDNRWLDEDDVDRNGAGSWGVITVYERAEAVGGKSRVESRPDGGMRAIVEVE